MKQVVLPHRLVEQILGHVLTSPSQEVCGLVGAIDGAAVSTYPVNNVSPEPDCRFEMDPSQQIAAMRVMRDAGESLFAIYHSHPQGPPAPSAVDVSLAGYPDALSLIVSLADRSVPEVRGYYVRRGQIEEVRLQMPD
ncbi:MAG: M67 family metallopeptidase [Gammaproteobacteria bacterium]|nr:M67 family metallopeptidase [Gammaproteobacteria bacterium]MDJ0893084.1 M67 family metallopeptidase [Gammaproteobacteria bacterium]